MPSLLPLRVPVLLAIALLGGCATTQPAPALAPFTSDGCSMFPDRSLWSDTDWCSCCVAHDLAYWRGGTAEQRLAADEALRACVLRSSGSAGLAELMFNGVRAGGEPTVLTSWRWAYGWPFGRNYTALTPDEQAAAKTLQVEYENNPQPRVCTK
jgi:hypothetical protein